ncbi:VWA domain-containing protein [Cytophagaceae bacterium YF14B1]|uniref:VWA domain-containing protein n=1 Tax=Xanthocytophaga flava TaxID=3048013 RepID=A0AAE3QNK0_9BACT|nr:VWA domain-containing protein [Xanthocytophaga flavus]MDJ1481971.1 VWA domain-containing protein [Xanthocytophaga flavus]
MNPFVIPSFDRFANPEAFGILLILPLIWLIQVWIYRKRQPVMIVSGVKSLKTLDSLIGKMFHLIPGLIQVIGAVFVSIALARPQIQEKSQERLPQEGVDIMIAMDVSRSMEAEDLKPNRLEAAKKAAQDFVTARSRDRVGLVIYSGECITACPPTTQHALLQNVIQQVDYQNLEDGTAIGLGLANAVNRLKDSKAKSKVIILLTDGENNAGFIAPQTAAEMARQKKIKVYTIGVGKNGLAPFPMHTFDGSKAYQQVPFSINEDLLRQIASQTGGMFYRADSRESLQQIYSEIDRLEKSTVEERIQYRYTEVFTPFLVWALMCLTISFLFRFVILRSVL